MKKYPRLFFLFALSLTLACAPVCSGDLYTGEVVIADESDSGREAAIREAFRQVLVKVTGSKAYADHQAMAGETAHAERYVLGYGFRDLAGDTFGPRRIQVRFSREKLERTLDEKGIPVWRAGRPSLLPWLSLEQGGDPRLMQPGLDDALLGTLSAAAESRGLPLLLPLMDLEDRAGIKASDLANTFSPNIRSASSRYGADVVLVGRLRLGLNGVWAGEWGLFGEGLRLNWSSAASGLRATVQEAVDVVADRLAERYAPTHFALETTSALLHVDQIESLNGYARVMAYLKQLGSVSELQVVQARPGGLSVQLRIRGTLRTLEQEMALGGPLVRERGAQPLEAGGGEAELHYRFQL